MAKKRRQKKEEGAPAWMVTFGDMMALLLTFFILLQMFSELKRDYEYQRVITAIKEAFGYSGGIGVLPVDDPPLKSVIEQLEQMAVRNYENTKISNAQDPGVEGPQLRVTKVREGIVFTIGGPSTFDQFSAQIKPAVREQIEKLAVLLKGRRNKVVIRGHAAQKHIPDNQPWKDLDELSFARARNVKDVLLELGIDDEVFRLEAVGTREPVMPRAIEPTEVAENRRVEVILTEQLVEEMNRDAALTDPGLARKGFVDG